MYFRFIRNKYHSVFSPDTFKHDMHIKINTYSVSLAHSYCTFAKSPRNFGQQDREYAKSFYKQAN